MTRVNFVESFSDSKGTYSTASQNPFSDNQVVVCYDIRRNKRFLKNEGWLDNPSTIFDLRIIFGEEYDVIKLAKLKNIESIQDLEFEEKRFSANLKALEQSKVDIQDFSIEQIVPEEILTSYLSARFNAVKQIWNVVTDEDILNYEKNIWPVYKNILKIEESKIFVDKEFISRSIKKNDIGVHERKFLHHMNDLSTDGFLKTRISPVGSKTWRLRVEKGFMCMSVPHGICREAIVSRFENGKIASLDFNAIDYRCIIKTVNDPDLNSFYENCDDFHARTSSLFDSSIENLRDRTKKITYVHIYGGSVETLQKNTILNRIKIVEMLSVLEKKFTPISLFRSKLSSESRERGFLFTPGGHKVIVEKDDHDGKVIGLFAQTFSSFILNETISVALNFLDNRKSKLLFTVHDELIFDVHPDDEDDFSKLVEAIQAKTGFKIKMKKGKNYAEATK